MDSVKKNYEVNVIAAALFIVTILQGLSGGGLSFVGLIRCVGFGMVTFSLFKKSKDMIMAIGFGLAALAGVFSALNAMRYIFVFGLPALAAAAASGLAAYIAYAYASGDEQAISKVSGLYILPAVLVIAGRGVGIVFTIASTIFGIGYYYSLNLGSLIGAVITAAAFYFAMMFVTDVDSLSGAVPSGTNKTASAKTGNKSTQVNGPEPEGYIGLVKHVLLLVFTFGIWYLIWIYKTTEFLNRVKGEEQRSAGVQLLLCMFVPFYQIFWVYKSAQRIDKLAAEKGISSDITMICLILAVVVGIVPPIVMQDKINSIVTAGTINEDYGFGTDSYSAAKNDSAAITGATVETVEAEIVSEEAVDEEFGIDEDAEAPVVDAEIVEETVPADADDSETTSDDAEETVEISEQTAEAIKTYKSLLDAGILTKEEFEAKKKQLLGL